MSSERMQNVMAEPMEPVEEPPRELTLDEAVSVAIQLQQNDQLAEAEVVYSRILSSAPDHPVALHFAGVLAHQCDRHDEAIALIEKSLQLQPGQADWHSNLGIVLQAQGRTEDAITANRRAIALAPNHANAYSNLGVLLRAAGKPDEAETAYRNAIRIDPNHVDAHTNLGVLLYGLKRRREAVACFCKVIVLRPKHREATRCLLALAHCALGEVDEAIKVFEDWLQEEPGNPIATHMLAACTGSGVPSRASDAFVQETFDSFAANFESKLAQLSYRAPRLVAAMLEDSGLEPAASLDVLDAGCGTGLCGPLVRPFARRLIGVDLSGGMVAQAAAKNVYDELVVGELTEYLTRQRGAFDVIVSADTLVYFGALEDVVAAASAALRPGGLLVFTVEHAVGEVSRDYRLELHGRYSHSRHYVERLLIGVGLMPGIVEADLRMESGVPVAGLVVRGTKPTAETNHG